MPMKALVRAVAEAGPDTVILSVALGMHSGQLRRTPGALRELELDPAPLIRIGGPALANAPDLAEKLGADGFVGSPREALTLVQRSSAKTDSDQ